RPTRARPGAASPATRNGHVRPVTSSESGWVAVASSHTVAAVKWTETRTPASGGACWSPRLTRTAATAKAKAARSPSRGGQLTAPPGPTRGRRRRCGAGRRTSARRSRVGGPDRDRLLRRLAPGAGALRFPARPLHLPIGLLDRAAGVGDAALGLPEP